MSILELIVVVTQDKKQGSIIPCSTVHKPHHNNETNCSKHANGWEIFYRIKAIVLQYCKCHRIGQCQGRHIESNTKGINSHKQGFIWLTSGLSHPEQTTHRNSCKKMTQTQQTLRLDIFVSHNTYKCRHKD